MRCGGIVDCNLLSWNNFGTGEERSVLNGGIAKMSLKIDVTVTAKSYKIRGSAVDQD